VAKVNQHQCWICNRLFDAVRFTAFMCSPRCRQWRSRFLRENGRFPRRALGEVAPWAVTDNHSADGSVTERKGVADA
jgi:hypothetical protein